MNIRIGDKALVTTDSWFMAPDGLQYRAVFGTVKAIRSSEATLGIKTNAKSTNWYVEVGNITIAGCQIHYAIKTDSCNLGSIEESDSYEDTAKPVLVRSKIYNAD